MPSCCRRHKCRCCHQLYDPEPRSRYHQRYCSKPDCQKASKAASHRRWRRSDKGRDYFRGSANTHRVDEWRRKRPGYARNPAKPSDTPVDDSPPQATVPPADTSALRELIDNRLIAWQRPLYQVLALGPPPPASQARSSQQIQSSPRRPAPPRPQPGRPVGLQSTGEAPPAPGNVEVGEAGEPHPLARIFRSMALDSARDRPLDSTSQRKTP